MVRGETIKLLAFTTTLRPTIKKKTSFPFTLLDPVNFPFFSPGGTENCHKITLVSSLWSAVTVTVSLKFSIHSTAIQIGLNDIQPAGPPPPCWDRFEIFQFCHHHGGGGGGLLCRGGVAIILKLLAWMYSKCHQRRIYDSFMFQPQTDTFSW